jgi:exonuclease VII large subunit
VHVGWPGAGAASQPAVAAAVAGAEGDWAVADVGARAPQLAVEAAVPSHQWRLRVMAPLDKKCMRQITEWLESYSMHPMLIDYNLPCILGSIFSPGPCLAS